MAGEQRARTRRIDAGSPLTLSAIVSVYRHGAGDPTVRQSPGVWTFGWRCADQPVQARFAQLGDSSVEVTAWGPGSELLLERVPALLGQHDDDSGFEAHHLAVARARSACPGWRMPASGEVAAALVPTILEQKVTGKQAFASYRTLVRRFGEPAPGPAAGLMVAPTATQWRAIPSWEWIQAGVDGKRAATIVRALASPGRIEECARLPLAQARARLASIPGVGVWTVAEVSQRALGDADAVSFGDYHVAKDIGWALTGTPVDDAGLEALLAPYAGHRYRVQRYLQLAGASRPRRGPRMTIPDHLPTRR